MINRFHVSFDLNFQKIDLFDDWVVRYSVGRRCVGSGGGVCGGSWVVCYKTIRRCYGRGEMCAYASFKGVSFMCGCFIDLGYAKSTYVCVLYHGECVR